MEWKKHWFPRLGKFEVWKPTGKLRIPAFWDVPEVIRIDYTLLITPREKTKEMTWCLAKIVLRCIRMSFHNTVLELPNSRQNLAFLTDTNSKKKEIYLLKISNWVYQFNKKNGRHYVVFTNLPTKVNSCITYSNVTCIVMWIIIVKTHNFNHSRHTRTYSNLSRTAWTDYDK